LRTLVWHTTQTCGPMSRAILTMVCPGEAPTLQKYQRLKGFAGLW
jgi:hypothetical protein